MSGPHQNQVTPDGTCAESSSDFLSNQQVGNAWVVLTRVR